NAPARCRGRPRQSRSEGYCTQLLFAVAASQVFASIPKLVSVVRELSANIGGVQALSVTHAVQLAPFPSTVVRSPVPNDAGSDGPEPHSVMNTGTLATAVAN